MQTTEQVLRIPLDQLYESPLNTRRHFSAVKDRELQESIRGPQGIITPLIVRPSNGRYAIGAGHRRFRAAKAVGCVLAGVLCGAAAAQPTAFTYQGELTQGAGPANGAYDFEFRLFDDAPIGPPDSQQGATVTRTGLELLLGQQAVLPFELAVSALQESVTVTGQAPVIETSQKSLVTNISPAEVDDLPVKGRQFVDLALLAPDPEVEADPEKHYDRVERLDLSTLEPYVVGPHSPDRARPVSALAAEAADPKNGFVDRISAALIGSCTNSSYEDMGRAADVAEQARARGVKAALPFLITPGSEQVRATIERDGQMKPLQEIAGTVLANACGPCIGQWRRSKEATAKPNTIVTSYNRNFPARNDGQASTMNFIASPEIVTAFALGGRLSFNPLKDTLQGADGKPFRLKPPKAAPEVPPGGFDRGKSNYIAPPADGSQIELKVSPTSERIQLMQPWLAWEGKDFLDMPVLIKAKGKTTTDAISPAGPWLRYRGHLDKFSDNMFMGAINAYTGEAGKTRNVVAGAAGRPVAEVARDYRSKGIKWVVVGDANYGEGSSREHAALSPRLLGGVAVIARSFARIHESNLKKQGLLALTFKSAADYDRIREDDRLSLVGLSQMAPGKPVTCKVRHASGETETLLLNHSFSAAQIEWFRAGSALNAVRGAAQSA